MIVKSSEERGNTASSAANVKRSMENLNKCVMYCTDEVRSCVVGCFSFISIYFSIFVSNICMTIFVSAIICNHVYYAPFNCFIYFLVLFIVLTD